MGLQLQAPALTQKGSGNTYTMLTPCVDDLLITGPPSASVADVRHVFRQGLP